MVQLAALAVRPSTFDPVRSTLAGASLLGSQVQNATALENLRTARRDQGALSSFAEQGGLGNPSALRALQGNPQLFTGALRGYTAHANWRNTRNAQGAHRVLMAGAPGSAERVQAWRQELESALSEQRIDQNTFAQLSARDPDDATLQRLIDMARPPSAEQSLSEVLRTHMPGGPPPGGGQGQRPPGFGGLTPEVLGIRAQHGLDPLGPGFPAPPPGRGATMDLPSYLFNLREQAGLNAGPGDVQAPPVGGPQTPPGTAPPPAPASFGSPNLRGPVAPPLDAPMFQGSPFQRGHAPPPSVAGLRSSLGLAPGTDVEPQGGAAPPPGSAPKGSRENPFTAREIESGADRNPINPPTDGVVYFRYADGRLGTIRRNPDGTEVVAPVDDGTRVHGWEGREDGQPIPVSDPPSVPGVTLGQQGDAVGTPGANLLGGVGGPPRPPTGPQTVGDAVHRILGARFVTDAQRIRFWSLASRAATRGDAMKLLQEIESGGVPLTASQRAERAASLRGEIRTIGTRFVGMQDAAGLIETALENLRTNPSTPGPWDVSMVINYMKMLDPESVVREGEYETARRTAGIPDQVWAWYQRAVSGAQLPSSVRTEIGRVSRSLLTVRREDFLRMQRQYTGVAERLGINPQDVVLDFTRPDSAPGGSRQETLLTDARRAIDAGAPEAAVRAELEAKGVNPSLLDR